MIQPQSQSQPNILDLTPVQKEQAAVFAELGYLAVHCLSETSIGTVLGANDRSHYTGYPLRIVGPATVEEYMAQLSVVARLRGGGIEKIKPGAWTKPESGAFYKVEVAD